MSRRARRGLIYCRISKDSTTITQPDGTVTVVHEGLGVDRQERECRVLAERLGIDVVDVLIDNDISGYRRKRRPGFELLVDTVKSGEIDVVIAWAPDRLTRHTRELEDLIDLLEQTSTTVQTVQAGTYDLTTPGGRATARILGATARLESELKSVRLCSKAEQKAAAGEPTGGGFRPFGYTTDRRHLVLAEANVITEAADRVLKGESLRAVCRDLNDRGVTTSRGGRWTGATLARVLRSPRIAGLLAHHGKVTADAIWPAVIDARTHGRLVALLRDPLRNTVGTRGRAPKMLTGFIYCGACGAVMKADSRTGGIRAYRCRQGEHYTGCGRVSMIAEPLEQLVGQVVVELLDAGALERAATSVESTGLAGPARVELAAIEDERRQLGEMFADVSKTFIRAALAKLDARETAANVALSADARALARSARPLALIADGVDAESWDDLPVETQRDVLHVLVARGLRIEIAPTAHGKRCGSPQGGIDRSRVSIRRSNDDAVIPD